MKEMVHMESWRFQISESCSISEVESLMRDLKALRHEGRIDGKGFKELKEQAKRKMRELKQKPHESLA